MSSATTKVLVTGSVNSRFADLFSKVQSIHEKHGPFDMLLCTGNFFAKDTSDTDLDALINGTIPVPMTTYFMSGDAPLPPKIADHIATTDGEVCSELYYLGKSGSLTTAQGVKIGFLSGVSEKSTDEDTVQYTSQELQKLKSMPVDHRAPAGIDILLTFEWPKDVQAGSAVTPSSSLATATQPIAELAAALKPRYHFAASENTFYEREPYKNITGFSGQAEERAAEHVTRFIGLGDALNGKKQRWFYAFNINPISKVDSKTLRNVPPNTTECPFVALLKDSTEASRKRPSQNGDNGSYFWGNEPKRLHTDEGQREPPPGYVCKRCQVPGHFIQDCPSKNRHQTKQRVDPNAACWFCLSNPKVEKHLVVSVGSEIYATLAKGPVVDPEDEKSVPGGGHILLVGIQHYPTFTKIPDESKDEALSEIVKYKKAISQLFEKHGYGMAVFEVCRESHRGMSHAHLQIVPIPKDKEAEMERIAREQGTSHGLTWTDQTPTDPDASYFKLELPGGVTMVHCIEPREHFNLQLGRLIISQALGKPEREDWKACAQATEEECRDANAFKEAFKSFDFTSD